jgi:tryptophan-rich sensory protein
MRAEFMRSGGAPSPQVRRPAMPLSGWLALPVVSAVLVGLEFPPGTWFASLAKPGPLPGPQLSGVVFCVLLALCGLAAWRIDRRRGARRAYALRLFLAQLALSLAWVAIFFGGHALGPAVAVMAVLWLALVATVVAFSRLDRVAGLLATPYLAWMTFVFQQNIALWTLN